MTKARNIADLGSNDVLETTSTGIDVDGTATMDGLTVDGGTTTTAAIKSTSGTAELLVERTDGAKLRLASGLQVSSVGTEDFTDLLLKTTATPRINIDKSGDISFYEDTGTTAKFFWDASAERLGIGETTPTDLLHIKTSNASTATGISTGVGIKLRNTDSTNNNYTTIQNLDSQGDQNAEIKFVNTSHNGNQGSIAFTTRSSTGEFAEKARIDASGNLLVGTTTYTGGSSPQNSSLATDAGVVIEAGGTVQIGRYQNSPLRLNRMDNDGGILEFRKDGTAVGSIGTFGSRLGVGTSDTGLQFIASSDAICPYNTSTIANRDAAIDFGLPTSRFKDLYLSGGVYLGGTGAANKLEDYEEGTWTPTLGTSGGGTYALATAYGAYTKIGRIVHCTVNLRRTSDALSGSGGDIEISIPFAFNGNTFDRWGSVVSYQNFSDEGMLAFRLANAQDKINLMYVLASGQVDDVMTNSQEGVTSQSYIQGSFTYVIS